MSGMGRREFITLLGSAAAASPLGARAQQPAMPVIGYISSLTQADSVHFDAAFRRSLSEMGYVEGQNVRIEYRWVTDRYSPLPAIAIFCNEGLPHLALQPSPPRFLVERSQLHDRPILPRFLRLTAVDGPCRSARRTSN